MCFDVGVSGATYVVVQDLHDEGRHAAVDADEEVDAGEDHVGRAWHAEEEGGRVHERSDGPAAEEIKEEGGMRSKRSKGERNEIKEIKGREE